MFYVGLVFLHDMPAKPIVPKAIPMVVRISLKKVIADSFIGAAESARTHGNSGTTGVCVERGYRKWRFSA